MKTATYNKIGGGIFTVEYDENAPCICCGEPVMDASMGGTVICPSCDCGQCRYCDIQLPMGRDQEDSIRLLKEHMAWHKAHPVK